MVGRKRAGQAKGKNESKVAKGRAEEEEEEPKPKTARGWAEEGLALDGRLLELDKPTLLNIARQADIRSQLAMERTCRRLYLIGREAGGMGGLRQLSFRLEERLGEGGAKVVDFVLAGAPHVGLSRGVRVRLSGPMEEGQAKPRPRPFLKALVEQLFARGARPVAFHVDGFSEACFTGVANLLRYIIALMDKEGHLDAVKSLSFGVNDDATLGELGLFLHTPTELVGFSSLLSNCQELKLRVCSRLRYLRLPGGSWSKWFWFPFWNPTPEELRAAKVKLLSQLRLFVVAGEELMQDLAADAGLMAQLSGGQLELQRQYLTKDSHKPVLVYATKDFHPDELKPLHLEHLWDEDLL